MMAFIQLDAGQSGCRSTYRLTENKALETSPWAFSPRTSSVGKAGTHLPATGNF
jgi:hypothetical protein